jgi:integrase
VGPGLTFHGLRHTAGKVLDELGCDTRTIAAVLGQRSEAMARHYSEEGDRRRRAVVAIKKLEQRTEQKTVE